MCYFEPEPGAGDPPLSAVARVSHPPNGTGRDPSSFMKERHLEAGSRVGPFPPPPHPCSAWGPQAWARPPAGGVCGAPDTPRETTSAGCHPALGTAPPKPDTWAAPCIPPAHLLPPGTLPPPTGAPAQPPQRVSTPFSTLSVFSLTQSSGGCRSHTLRSPSESQRGGPWCQVPHAGRASSAL